MTHKNDWLQVLRGLAALAVFFFHFGPHWALMVPGAAGLTRWTHAGFAGVDVFFVLSGFVVYASAERAPFVWNGFLLRRVLRVFLGYWPVLALLAVLDASLGDWPPAHQVWDAVWLLNPTIFDSWLPTAWSLMHELYFYALITLFLALVPAAHRLACMLGVMALLVLHGAAWWLLPLQDWLGTPRPLPFATTSFAAEFLAGAVIAHVRARQPVGPRTGTARVRLVAGLMLMAGGLAAARSLPAETVTVARVLSLGPLGTGALLAALAASDLRWRAPPALVLLGDASFAFYLLHPVLLEALGLLREQLPWRPGWGMAPTALATVALTIGVSILWWRQIERPLFERVAGSRWVAWLSRRWMRAIRRTAVAAGHAPRRIRAARSEQNVARVGTVR